MTGRRCRFTAEFKKRVALEALHGDGTEQAMAAKREAHRTRRTRGRGRRWTVWGAVLDGSEAQFEAGRFDEGTVR